MKVLRFLINSNIYIALAAVSLALATEVQLGMHPRFQIYFVVVFFATLFDYNAHRFIAVYNKPEAIHMEKLQWAAEHLGIVKTLLIFAASGLVISRSLYHIKRCWYWHCWLCFHFYIQILFTEFMKRDSECCQFPLPKRC